MSIFNIEEKRARSKQSVVTSVGYEPAQVSSTPQSELDEKFGFKEGLEGDAEAIPRGKRSRGQQHHEGKNLRYQGFVSITRTI